MTPKEAVEIDKVCARYALNDLGNARRLVTRFGKELDCAHDQPEFIALAVQTVEEMFTEVDSAFSDSCDDERYEALLAWAKASGMRERIDAMIYLARGLV